jgi:hypothetical protein
MLDAYLGRSNIFDKTKLSLFEDRTLLVKPIGTPIDLHRCRPHRFSSSLRPFPRVALDHPLVVGIELLRLLLTIQMEAVYRCTRAQRNDTTTILLEFLLRSGTATNNRITSSVLRRDTVDIYGSRVVVARQGAPTNVPRQQTCAPFR